MTSTSLVRNMNLPIPYYGPLQTNLECLRLYKQRITQNYKRVMERIFFEIKIALERPVIVKIFDDRMEFYPIFGRKVPISELRYVDVLAVLSSRDERKVLVAAIPANDNTKGIWIIGMRFHRENSVCFCGGRLDSVCQMPRFNAPARNATCVSSPCIPVVLEHEPLVKEEMTPMTNIGEKAPIEQTDVKTCYIRTPSPKKGGYKSLGALEPVCPELEKNISVTEKIVNFSRNKSSRKSDAESIYMVIPENMNNKTVQTYLAINASVFMPKDEELCVVFKESLEKEYPWNNISIKAKVNATERSVVEFSKPFYGNVDIVKESDLWTLPRTSMCSSRRFIVKPLEGVESQSPRRRPFSTVLLSSNNPLKLERLISMTRFLDGQKEKIIIPYNALPGRRHLPEKDWKVEILQRDPDFRKSGGLPDRCHKIHLQAGRRLSSARLRNKLEIPSEPRSQIPFSMPGKIIMSHLLDGQKEEKALSRSNAPNMRMIFEAQEDFWISSTEDDSSESSSEIFGKKVTKVKILKVPKNLNGRKETTKRKEFKIYKDFVLTKQRESVYMFLPEGSLRINRFLLTQPGEKRIDCFGKANNVPLEYDGFSKLQCQRSREEPKYQEGKIVIIREEICSDFESSSTLSIESPIEHTFDLPQVPKVRRKSSSSESSQSLESLLIDSVKGIGRLDVSSRDKLNQSFDSCNHSGYSADESAELDKPVDCLDCRGRPTAGFEEEESTRVYPCCCHGACGTLCCEIEKCACTREAPFKNHPSPKHIQSQFIELAAASPPMKSRQIKPQSRVLERPCRHLLMSFTNPMKITEKHKKDEMKKRKMEFQTE